MIYQPMRKFEEYSEAFDTWYPTNKQVKPIYFSADMKMWACERFDGNKHTSWSPTEEDAKRDFMWAIKDGYEVVENFR